MPNGPVPAAAPGLPNHGLDDLEWELKRLGHLLAATLDILTEMPHIQLDGVRMLDVDRAEALTSLACDLTSRIADGFTSLRGSVSP